MATESFRRRSPSADVPLSIGSSSDLEVPTSGEVCAGIDGACGPSLTSSVSSPGTPVPASDGSAEEKKLEVVAAGIDVPRRSPAAALGNGSVKRTTRASLSSSSLTAEDGEPLEVNGSHVAKKRKKKGAASGVPASPDDCSASSKPRKLDGARRAHGFVGDPVPEEEAKRRWPYRFVEKNTNHNARVNAHNAGDDDDEIILDVESHYLQASISGCILDIGDCAYVKGEKGKPNYVGRILEFFKTIRDEYYFRVQWFFRAQDTVMKEQAKFHDKKRLFYSDLKNDNLLDCIVSKVRVIQVPHNVDLKSSITSSCEYYYDMKYSLEYSTFSVINTKNEECINQGHKSHVSQKTELAVLDLYSGCGGMSTGLHLGAHVAGVTLMVRWAVDYSEAACQSFKLNHPETQVRNETADDFFSLLKEWKKLCKMYTVNSLENSRHHEESEREHDKQHPSVPAGEYEVLKLVDICYGDPTNVGKRGLKFKVRWKGYNPSEDTWEPISNLRNCQDRIREFVTEWSKLKRIPLPGDVDVVCGGPPCQGISGYNRFRNFEAPLEDERNRQIVVFMDIVEFLKPKYVLMENVVDILKFAKATLGRYAISRLVSNNYQTRLGMLAAGCYGLPQFRLRTFIWGCHSSEKLPQFPLPTHDTILKGGTSVEFERNLVGYDEGQERELEKAIVLEDALSDLPPVKNLEVHEKMDYGKSPQTEFQRYIRASKYEMLALSADDTSDPDTFLYDHYPSPLFEDDYLRVCQIPHRKGANFRDLPGVIVASNNTVHLDPKMEPVLLPSGRQLVPNYAINYWDGKSLRPFSRLWWDEVVATVLTIPDCHCQTILHPEQDRVLTIRECARIQGFPDWYRFAGTVKERYQQIGNAVAVSVSRVLGYALAMAWLGKVGNEPLMTLPSKFSLSHMHNLNPSSPEVIDFDSVSVNSFLSP